MLLSAIPPKLSFAWGYGAVSPFIRAIPQTTATPGAASFALGYPPSTFDIAGTPPDGQDENGILNQITLWLQWMNAGGAINYDGTFQAAIGGYPNQAVVGSVVTAGLYWRSTVDNNTTNPDSAGAGWVAFPSFQTAATAAQIWAGTDNSATVTALAMAGTSGQQILTDASTITWNMALGQDAAVTLTSAVGGSRGMGTPTNIVPGRSFSFAVRQPASGGPCAIATNGWASIWDWGGAGAPTLSTGASVRDLVTGKHDQLTSKLVATFWAGS